MARSLMIWGTSSGAGKSLLCTALCRWAAQRGVDVAPYKAQNMSNNARVVPGLDGGFGEIGAAQYFQALAARVAPTVDMNPVLLKPESDVRSQVVLQGRVAAELAGMPWRERSAVLAQSAAQSFARLAQRHEVIVIEGAGSPAEINLASADYVNLDTARWAAAAGSLASLLVTDIDRGGAFAHLYGTWALLPDDLRPSLQGFVLNKFRGDAVLLSPGPALLQARSGVPMLGVLPMRRDHGLPDEDGVFEAAAADHGDGPGLHVAIVAWPHISNLDEFQPLRQVPGLRLSWARDAASLAAADWIVLPGSKQVSGDLAWLRQRGMDQAVQRHAQAGKPVLGICGGLQALGQWLDDPQGADGQAGSRAGLGLLPLHTRYASPKRVLPVQARFGELGSPWSALSGLGLPAYEIRNGVTNPAPDAQARVVLFDAHGQPIGWQQGSVLGVYAHGLFEAPALLKALFGQSVRTLDESLDGLAALVDEHFEPGVLACLFDRT
ncbi:cobyric acid synthase [Ideonella sp.]|uniref:cobyric acid synthase n=1 Tax=Ideonella sp. TaxID=1929293 RepID=UPI003BB698FA